MAATGQKVEEDAARHQQTDAEVSYRTHQPVLLVRHPTTHSNHAHMQGHAAWVAHTARTNTGDSAVTEQGRQQLVHTARWLWGMLTEQRKLGHWGRRVEVVTSSMQRTTMLAACFLMHAPPDVDTAWEVSVTVDQHLTEVRKTKPAHFVSPTTHLHLLTKAWPHPVRTVALPNVQALHGVTGAATLARLADQQARCENTPKVQKQGFATKIIFGHSLHLSEIMGGERSSNLGDATAPHLSFHLCNAGATFGWLGRDLFDPTGRKRTLTVKFANRMAPSMPSDAMPCTEHP